jgi:threonine/homoserine/homoserine lactone efflux protein
MMDTAIGIATTSFLVGLSGAMMPGPVLTVTIGETAARIRAGGSAASHAGSGPSLSGNTAAGLLARVGHGSLVRGALVGPLIVLGHAILEVCLVIAVVLGLGRLLVKTPVMGTIGILGGAVLIWMAWGMFHGMRDLTLQTAAASALPGRNPVLAGILTSLSNPYWAVWWATIGLGYIALSMRFGVGGLAAFYLGHILSDLVWYSAISLSLAVGHRLLTDRVYRGLVAVCASFLLVFGLYFGYAGIRALVI